LMGDRIMQDDDFALRRWARIITHWVECDSVEDEVYKDLMNHGFVSIALQIEPSSFRTVKYDLRPSVRIRP